VWFRAAGLTRVHRWLITSASAVLSSPINYLLSFEYRTALSGPKNKREIPGNDLLSHPVARAVPSALVGLTAVFGMGTGVSPPL
jgi:hypothetical protein